MKSDSSEADRTEVALIDYLDFLWQRKATILGGTLLVVVIALGARALIGPRYGAVVLMRVNDTKLEDLVRRDPVIGLTLAQMVQSRGIGVRVLAENGLSSQDVEEFIGKNVRVEPIVNTNLFRLSVSLPNATLAAEVANDWADEAVRLNATLNQNDVVGVRDFLRAEVDDARTRLAALEQELVDSRVQAEAERLENRVSSLLALENSLNARRLRIEGMKARLLEAATQSEALPREEGAAALNAELGLAGVGPEGMERNITLSSVSPMSDPARGVLEVDRVLAEVELAEAERQREVIVGLVRDLQPLQTQLLELQKQTRALNVARDIANASYQELSRRYEEARVTVASRSASLQVVDPAVPPATPSTPGVLQTILLSTLAGSLGLTLLTGLVQYGRLAHRARQLT